jgi:hypothetical protein
MTVRLYRDPTEWASALDQARLDEAGVTVVLIQAKPLWLTAARAPLLYEIERALGRLLVAPFELQLARVLLYDPPGVHVGAFLDCDREQDAERHSEMTEALRDWLRVVDTWSTVFTTKRHLARDRPEDERYQVKSWVVAKLTDEVVARSEAQRIPGDMLLIADAGQELAELFPMASSGLAWADSRMLWMNGPASGLDPTVGRRASEILAAGTARFFSVDITAERWWGGEEKPRT